MYKLKQKKAKNSKVSVSIHQHYPREHNVLGTTNASFRIKNDLSHFRNEENEFDLD